MDETTQQVLDLVKKKMTEQGAYDHSAYKQYIEETIDYFIDKGKLNDDDNLELMEDILLDMWEDVRNEMSEITDTGGR